MPRNFPNDRKAKAANGRSTAAPSLASGSRCRRVKIPSWPSAMWLAFATLWTACLAYGLDCRQASAQDAAPSAVEPIAPREQDAAAAEQTPSSPPLSEYMGRTIAATMSYHGAPWLFRSEREDEERCSLLLANLGLRRGMTVCDLGCGNGFYTMPIARLIGNEGKVLAVDIQSEMLDMLRENAEEKEIENITPILGLVDDPRLPAESVDLVLLCDVYHEFSHPEPMLARIRESLKPNGRVALVEFRAEDENVPIKPEHKMSKAQIMKEFPANGFKLVEEFDKLPWQHLMFFEKSDEPNPEEANKKRGDKERLVK